MPLEISACFIVKNEERFLMRALKSIRPYVAEIVVLDTGSKDSSPEIAKRLADVTGQFAWIGDFSAARNACAELASYDWIFTMDADEEVVEFDEKRVAELLSDVRAIGRYRLNGLTESGEDERTYLLSRVYNRKHCAFANPIHEVPVPLDGGERRLVEIPVTVNHYGHMPSIAATKDRNARNRAILLDEIAKDPSSAYNYFQLGNNYNSDDDKQAACDAYAKALSLERDVRKEYFASLVESYGNALIAAGHYEKALELLRYRDVLTGARNQFTFGIINMNSVRFDQAVECFRRCIVKGSAVPYESCMPRYNIGVIYECTGRVEEALAEYAACGDFLPARARLKANNR